MHTRQQPSRISLLVLVITCLLLAFSIPAPPRVTPDSSDPGTPIVTAPTRTPTRETSTPGPTATPVRVAGELHLAVREDIETLNPYLVSNASEEFVISLVFDTLLDCDMGGSLVPNLAQGWELADDGVTLVFRLNTQARWHNGEPVTVEDVLFSFELVLREQLPGMARIAALIDRVEAPTAQEIKFVLLTRRADAVRLLGTQVRIVPSDLWEDVGDPLSYANLDYPVGSGPFSVLGPIEGNPGVLVNTKTHHCTKPMISSLVLEILHDEDEALQMLERGELDALGWDVPVELARAVNDDQETHADIVLIDCPGISTHTVLLNLRKAPYDSVAFREALAQAVDAAAIIDQVLMGFGDAALPSLSPPASPWRDEEITPIAYDPRQAMERLEAAGFRDRDGDGLRENPDGSGLVVSFVCSDLPVSMRVAELVATNWETVGISTEVTAVEQDLVVPTLVQAQFDAILHSISLGDAEMDFFHFHSSRGVIKQGRVFGLNYGGYANPDFDEIVSVSLGEQDLAARRDLLHQVQDILARDVPQIPLYVPRVVNLYRSDRFVGWSAEPGVGVLNRRCVANLSER